MALIKNAIRDLDGEQERFPGADLSVARGILAGAVAKVRRIERSSNWDCQGVLGMIPEAMIAAGRAITSALVEDVRRRIIYADVRVAGYYNHRLELILVEARDENLGETHGLLKSLQDEVRARGPICASMGEVAKFHAA